MNNSDYELLRSQQRKIEESVDALRKDYEGHAAFIRAALSKHIESRYAHGIPDDLTDAMIDLVREGKASMTVSYNLYPVEKESDRDGR